MTPSRSTSRNRAFGGLALASIFLTAQLTGFVHRLEVQHEICAEHGELIHVVSTAAVSAGRALADAPDAVDHGHEHCLVGVHRREDVVVPPSLDALIVQQVELQIVTAPHPTIASTGIALLRLAPKSSPPA